MVSPSVTIGSAVASRDLSPLELAGAVHCVKTSDSGTGREVSGGRRGHPRNLARLRAARDVPVEKGVWAAGFRNFLIWRPGAYNT